VRGEIADSGQNTGNSIDEAEGSLVEIQIFSPTTFNPLTF